MELDYIYDIKSKRKATKTLFNYFLAFQSVAIPIFAIEMLFGISVLW